MVRLACLFLVCLVLAGCATGNDTLDGAGELPDAQPGDNCSLAGVECCNGADDDGDSLIDEGTATELCGTVNNGTPRCDNLSGCSVSDCDVGFADLDGEFATGCECGVEMTENNSDLCDDAVDIGALADSGEMMDITGVIAPVGESDWFRVLATDSLDTACDTFHFRAQFTSNPGNQYTMAVTRAGCLGTLFCEANTDVEWFTNFAMPGVSGQCPCTADNARQSNVSICADDTAEYLIQVTRLAGATPTCESYIIEVSNGIY